MFFKWIINFWPVQAFRDRRAKEILKVLIDSGAIEVFWGKKEFFDLGLDQGKVPLVVQKRCIDLGSGQGEIPLAIAKETGCFFTCVEKYSNPSEKVRKRAERKLSWHKGDAITYLRNTREHSVDIIFTSYFLQVLSSGEQYELFQEIRRVMRPGGKVVFIEEHKREWPGRWIDSAMNKFLNVFNKQRYEIYSEKTWDNVFGVMGIFLFSRKYKFGRNSILFVFQF